MSPHAVNNFVTDLVEMAKAMEELPKVQAELATTQRALEDANKTIASVKDTLEQSISYASTLEQKVRDTEVAKDQAETMFLEASERTDRVLDFVKTTFGTAGALIQALEPPKMPEPVQDQSVTDPTANAIHGHTQDTAPASVETSVSADSGHLGQSEPNPTSTGSIAEKNDVPVDTAQQTVIPTEAAVSTAKPYAGIRYYDHPTYVNREAWLAGGGTIEDYDWRPERRQSVF